MRGRTSIGRRHALVKPYACRFIHRGRTHLCLPRRLSRRADTRQGDRTMVTLRWHAVACGRPPGWPIAECGTQCAEDAQITGDGTTALNTRSVGMELYCTCGYPIW